MKRRAARACVSCRVRKVRCDVVGSGPPCTNCRLDNVACKLAASNRGRPRLSAEEDDDQPLQTPVPRVEGFPASPTFDDPHNAEESLSENNDESHRQRRRASHMAPTAGSASMPSPLVLPSYIRPLPSCITHDDIEYLQRKGALTLPDEEFQSALLRAYLQYVQPFMPSMEVGAFFASIVQPDSGTEPVSLILFHAVMFAGIAYVDEQYLTARGFSSRRAARRIFFDRCRLLYALDCETDRVALFQSLLLMSYWYDRPEDEKESWYWLRNAVSLAQILGLHRDPSHLNLSVSMKRLRKRLWWSCFIRDRLIAIAIRRPLMINAAESNVPMLVIDDFEQDVLNDDVVRSLGPTTLIDDAPAKRTIFIACIELAKLCIHIGEILTTQYSIIGDSGTRGDETFPLMVAPKAVEQSQNFIKCDLALEEWHQSLNAACRYARGDASFAYDRGVGGHVLCLHYALLSMIYHSAVIVLHRPRAMHSSSEMVDSLSVRTSQEKAAEAAIEVTEIAHDLISYNLLRYTSTSCVTAVLSGALIHLINARSTKEDARNLSIGRFYQCWEALQQLRDMYASADHAVKVLENVIHRTSAHIPMLRFSANPPKTSLQVPTLTTRHENGPDSMELSGRYIQLPSSLADSSSRSVHYASRVGPSRMAANGSGTAVTDQRPPSLAPSPSVFAPRHPSRRLVDATSAESALWTDFDMEDNIVQALIQFDSDPNLISTMQLNRLQSPRN